MTANNNQPDIADPPSQPADEEEQRWFNVGVAELFDTAFEKRRRGELTHEDVRSLFPRAVLKRCSQ